MDGDTVWMGIAILLGLVVAGVLAVGKKIESEEYVQGYKAYIDKKYLNPHPEGSQEAKDWTRGQQQAFIDSHPMV